MMLSEDPDRDLIMALVDPRIRGWVENLERGKANAEASERNQRGIAAAAEADYRRAKAQRDVYAGVLRKIWALSRGRSEIDTKVLRGMISKTDVV